MNKLMYVVSCLSLFVLGCATEAPVPPPSEPGPAVVVQDMRRTKTNDGYDRVQYFVKNMTMAPVRTHYRVDWMDMNGVVIEDPDHSGWEKATLAAGDEEVFTSIAPRKNCADCKLRMK